jgi:protein-L-isoaspartate(D-aspartate) O-methyltransferase
MTNVELARFNMVEQQVRPWDVLDPQVLELMESTPREAFVPQGYENVAYADIEIPIGHGETMLAPKYVGRMLQALNLHKSDVALEVGCGTGYVTALLAKACREVISVDIHADLVESARQNLRALDLNDNVMLETGDAANGWDAQHPYDVIIVTGSLPVLPETFQNSLNRGGRMVAVVGTAPVMEAILLTRTGTQEWRRETLFETNIKALANSTKPQRFVF